MGSFIVWSGSVAEAGLLTRSATDSKLTAVVPASLLKDPGSAQLRVVNGDVMGWIDGYRGYPESNAVSFAVVVSGQDGRWKLGGDGSCYFDANDSGPNQCELANEVTWIRR